MEIITSTSFINHLSAQRMTMTNFHSDSPRRLVSAKAPKSSVLTWRVCVFASIPIILFVVNVLIPENPNLVSLLQSRSTFLPKLNNQTTSNQPEEGLTVITLTYGGTGDARYIAHNCAMLQQTRHRFIIHTDHPDQSFCNVCECERFIPFDCKCPDGKCQWKNPCQKLYFYIWALRKYKEFVLLDSDLMILKKNFLDRLQPRTKMHDFLATYGHAGITATNYKRNFNSGLIFIRYLPELDYDWMKRTMYETKAGFDQGILSGFVHNFYDNWDSLSWKWHCRGLIRFKQDLPLSDCYTFHDRTESKEIISKYNITLKSID